jgi:hypothetical protein
MRRFIITGALLANALSSGLLLLLLLDDGGWGSPASLSVATAQLLVVVAAAAFALNLLLAPVLGISFWARDRGTRRLEERLETPAYQPPGAGSALRPTEGTTTS